MAKEKVIRWSNPFLRLGIERGRRQRRSQAESELVLKQLKHRVGSLTTSQQEAIRKLNLRDIEAIAEALLDFRSGTDLDQWLLAHSK